MSEMAGKACDGTRLRKSLVRPAKRAPLPRRCRVELARVTRLEGNELSQLIDEFEILGGIYQEHTSEPAKREEAKAAKWYRDFAKACDKLAILAERRPERAVIGDPLDARELRRYALHARADAELHQPKQRARKNPDNRQRSRGADLNCRNWLAQEACRVTERHCPGLTPANLRRVVATLLKAVGATFSEPFGHPNQFDRMMRPSRQEHGNEESLAREQRLEGIRF
jgi:hypothetical protein